MCTPTRLSFYALLLIQVVGACCCWVEWGHTHAAAAGNDAATAWAADSGEPCHEHDDCVRTAPVPEQLLTQLPPLDLLPLCLDALIPDGLSTPWRLAAIPDRLAGTLPPAICRPLLT